MSEQLPSRMSVELSLAGGEPVEVNVVPDNDDPLIRQMEEAIKAARQCLAKRYGGPVPLPDRAIGPERSASHLDRLAAAMAWLERLPPLLGSFLASLSGDRLDATTIGAFADYLEENGHTAEGQRVRLLRPQPGDVLVVWVGAKLAEVRQEQLSLPGVAVVALYQDERIEAIDPEQLRAAGWVREEEAVERVRAEREACARLIEDVGEEVEGPRGLATYLAGYIRGRGD